MSVNEEKQLEDILEIESGAIDLDVIERLSSDSALLGFYEAHFEGGLYSNILMSLTHEVFDEAQAELLWGEILKHKNELCLAVERDVGVFVAAVDYLTNIEKILHSPRLIEQEKSDFVSRVSTVDELTGLYARDVFDIVLKKEFGESKRSGKSLCLSMLDIDNFKQVNDKYGHPVGDEVLANIGEVVNQSVRQMDMATRYGGEELALIMPDSSPEEAVKIVNRLRKTIASCTFSKDFSVTVSAGVASIDKNTRSPEILVVNADKALYQAKNSGKNCVVKYQ